MDVQAQRAKSAVRKSKKTNVNLLNVMNRNKAKLVSRQKNESKSRRLTSFKDKAWNLSAHQKLMEAKSRLLLWEDSSDLFDAKTVHGDAGRGDEPKTDLHTQVDRLIH